MGGPRKKKGVGRGKKKQLTVSSALINDHLQPSFRNSKCLKTENRNVNHKMGRTGLCVASIAAFNETLWSGLEVRLIHGNDSCWHFAINKNKRLEVWWVLIKNFFLVVFGFGMMESLMRGF